MPVRLIQPFMDQAANTLYWGTGQRDLLVNGIADTNLERASDYTPNGDRIVTTATATASENATTYRMNSGSAQALTIPLSGWWGKDTVLTVIQAGAGATTLTPAAGVTITPGNGLTGLVTQGVNRVAQLIKGAGETWVAIGGLGT